MRYIAVFVLLAAIQSSAAIAADPYSNSKSAMTGFLQGITEARQRQNATRQAEEQTQARNSALLEQYKQCLYYNPDGNTINAYTATASGAQQCVTAFQDKFLHAHPDTPVAWFIHGALEGGDEAHTATKEEAEHLAMLIKNRQECSRPIFHYSGAQNDTVRATITAVKKREASLSSLADDYIHGKITRGAFLKQEVGIGNAYTRRMNKISVDLIAYTKANNKQREQFCDAQLSTNQQSVQSQQMMQVIEQQQQQIQRQQQEIENANWNALQAQGSAESAWGAAQQANQNAHAIYR